MDDARFLPSPDEITAGCLRIQSTWSPEERERRRLRSLRLDCHDLPAEAPVEVQFVRQADLGRDVDAWE